jgi:multidrug resistance protein
MKKTSSSPKVLIFMTVFLYLVGFGIIIPILPLLGKELGGSASQIGWLMAIFSFMQFVFAPLWGHFSDRYGRRPILVSCLLGEALTYVWFAFARDYTSLFLARMLAGFFGASLSTASAYISDITPPKERSKGMAIIGAAFGLGFVIGPALGGILIKLGKGFSTDPLMGSTFASLFVAALCLCTFIFAYFKLPESLTAERRLEANTQNKKHRFTLLAHKLKTPVLNTLILTFFCNTLGMASMEATLILFVGAHFGWTAMDVSFGFAYIGMIMIFTQGYLVRKLIPKVGERKMAILGFVLFSLGMAGISISSSINMLAVAMTFLAFGNGFSNPSLMGSISLASSDQEQGVNMGVAQSASSLGRILGPLMGGYFYDKISDRSPFLLSATIGVIALFMLVSQYKKLPNSAQVS